MVDWKFAFDLCVFVFAAFTVVFVLYAWCEPDPEVTEEDIEELIRTRKILADHYKFDWDKIDDTELGFAGRCYKYANRIQALYNREHNGSSGNTGQQGDQI